VLDGWSDRLRAAGLDSLHVFLEPTPPNEALPGRWEALIKPGLGGRERWRWQPPASASDVLYVKRYRHIPWRQQLDRIQRQAPRHSRAWWEFARSRELNDKSVPSVRAVAMVEQMRSLMEVSSAVVFAEVAGDAFDRVWPEACQRGAPVTRGAHRHAVTRQLAWFVSALHQSGWCHRDLYLCHVFTELDESAGRPPRFALIDLARLHRPRWRRTRWLIKDLSQLDCSARQIGATRADRFRFLVTYLGLQPRTPRVRWYMRRIARKSDRILRRIARKSRRA
jgi:hypothetical protein